MGVQTPLAHRIATDEIDPNDASKRTEELVRDAQLLIDAGDFHQAEACLYRVPRRDPKQANAFYLLGTIALARGRYLDAAVEFRRATEIEPNRSEFFNGLGTALHATSTRGIGLSLWRRSANLPPPDVAYQRALELDSGNIGALRNLAMCLKESQRFEEARNAYTLLMAVDTGRQ